MKFLPEKKKRLASAGQSWMLVLVIVFLSFATNSHAVQDFTARTVTTSTTVTESISTRSSQTEKADQIVVYKAKRMLYLLKDGHIIRKYRVALGKNPVGHKLEMGDRRTPEGRYRIDWKNPESKFYRSLRISYPDKTDAGVAASLATHPGDLIMIHGMPNDRDAAAVGHPLKDWTDGCIAVTNEEIMEIWKMVNVGTPISIWP